MASRFICFKCKDSFRNSVILAIHEATCKGGK